jgi:hypothetical protein
MKVQLLTFSTTGNNKHAANTIGKLFTESSNHAQHIDNISISKKLNLGQLSESPIDYISEESLELDNLKD